MNEPTIQPLIHAMNFFDDNHWQAFVTYIRRNGYKIVQTDIDPVRMRVEFITNYPPERIQVVHQSYFT